MIVEDALYATTIDLLAATISFYGGTSNQITLVEFRFEETPKLVVN